MLSYCLKCRKKEINKNQKACRLLVVLATLSKFCFKDNKMN